MKKLFYLLAIISFTLTSCTEVIDVDVPETAERLVVEGMICTERDSSYVLLSKSVSYFSDGQIPAVTNAHVEVNGVHFTHAGHGYYYPPVGYTGVINTMYNLKVIYDGSEFTASSMLDPMYDIDTVTSVFKQKEGFLREGWTAVTWGTDNRPRVKYTMFRFGFKNQKTEGKDSLFNDNILFDNRSSKLGERTPFELPFLRLEKNDTVLMIYRSIDQTVYNFYLALESRGGGGPFSTPPANLPTNIRGGALGIFMAQDVKRFRVRL